MAKYIIWLVTPGTDTWSTVHYLLNDNVDRTMIGPNDTIAPVYFRGLDPPEQTFMNSATGSFYSVLNKFCSPDVPRITKLYDYPELFVNNNRNSHVPNRNMTLMMSAMHKLWNDRGAAIRFHEATELEIWLNTNKADRAPDNSEEFLRTATDFLNKTSGFHIPITVTSPIKTIEKEEILYSSFLRDEFQTLRTYISCTYACYSGIHQPDISLKYLEVTERRNPIFQLAAGSDTFEPYTYLHDLDRSYMNGCLSCPSCVRKIVALSSIGIYIPLANFDLVNNLYNEAKNDKTFKEHYPLRAASIMRYVAFAKARYFNNMKINDNDKELFSDESI